MKRRVSFVEYVRITSQMSHLELRKKLGWSKQLYQFHKTSTASDLKFEQVLDLFKASRLGRRKFRRMLEAYYGGYI